MKTPARNPASILPLWDVFSPVVVTTSGVSLWGMELGGLDSEHLPAERLLNFAQGLYHDLACQVPEQTILQFIMDSHSDYSDVFESFDTERCHSVSGSTATRCTNQGSSPEPEENVLGLQRRRRLEFLKGSNLRRHSLYLFVGSSNGLTRREFCRLDKETHRKRMGELLELVANVKSVIESAGVDCWDLEEDVLLNLFWNVMNGDAVRSPPVVRVDGSRTWENKAPVVRTIRERLVHSEMRWEQDHLRIGDRFCRVLTLRDLPEQTGFTDAELFYRIGFDFRLSVTVQIPPQERYKSALDQRRRIAKADAGRGGNIEDYKRTGRVREGEELAALIAETGQRLVLLTVQAVIWSKSKTELETKTRHFQEKARAKGYVFFQETAAHDRELVKTLPGGSASTERQLLVTSNNAVDLIPIFQEDHGDKDPVMLVKTERGELFSFNPFEESRDNWNATIFGASGSGKSVFVNLMIATSVLSSHTKGRLIVVDFAGPQKSSYLMLGKMFGGEYVPVLSSEHSLNPFPPPKKALDKDGKVEGKTESFLTILTDMLISNEGKDKSCQLFRQIVQKGIRDTYKRLGDKTPIYDDLLETLKGYSNNSDVDQKRLPVVVDLLGGFLESRGAGLLNRPSKATPDSPFLIIDLHGVDNLEPKLAQAITFLTANWVKEMAFDASDPGNKYVILDEVAQLIRRPEMVGLLDELYSTSRKHRTSVWTVTQSYQTYRQSSLAETIKLNSTTQIFLSHASDESGRRRIAEDFQFSRREKHLFDQLRTVKGKFSTALIRTEAFKKEKDDKHYLTSILRIDLSPLDYQICTSDAKDRDVQQKYINANPDRPLYEVLEYIAGLKNRQPLSSEALNTNGHRTNRGDGNTNGAASRKRRREASS